MKSEEKLRRFNVKSAARKLGARIKKGGKGGKEEEEEWRRMRRGKRGEDGRRGR